MSSTTTHDLIILGGGPAGLTAAIYASRAGVDALTIEQGAFGGQISTTDEVDNYPGLNGINGAELGTKFQEHAEQLGAQFAYDTITSLTKDEQTGLFTLEGDDGTYAARAVIYAAGATPRHAGFEGEDTYRGRGVSYCATCDGMFYRNKHVLIVGGGNSACEEALYLSKLASDVTMVVRKDHVRALGTIAKRVEENEKITVRYLTSITKLEGETLPTAITFRSNETGAEETDVYEPGSFGIFVSVGHIPQTELVKNLVELAPDGSVIAEPTMATKTPGLYVAGDVRQTPLRQVITAAADGAIAANSAAMYLGDLVI